MAWFDWLEGFATWQTPLSFLAGIGTHHLYCKFFRDNRNGDGVQDEE